MGPDLPGNKMVTLHFAVWGKDEEPDEPPDGNVCVFDAAIERMEKAAGVTLDDTRQEELVRALGSYLT